MLSRAKSWLASLKAFGGTELWTVRSLRGRSDCCQRHKRMPKIKNTSFNLLESRNTSIIFCVFNCMHEACKLLNTRPQMHSQPSSKFKLSTRENLHVHISAWKFDDIETKFLSQFANPSSRLIARFCLIADLHILTDVWNLICMTKLMHAQWTDQHCSVLLAIAK